MPSKLGYWDTRGLGEPIRYFLRHVGEDFEDFRYVVSDGPEFSLDQWFSVKYEQGLSFPNLPYYMDGQVMMTQSNSILRYLGRKYGKDGETPQEKADCDMGLEVVMDLRNEFVQLCYFKKFAEERENHVNYAKKTFKTFNEFLGEKKFFVGATVTACDFPLYEMLVQHRQFEPSILDDFPKLKDYIKRFEDLPGIKEYLATGKTKATPINNKMASFIN